MAFSTTSNIQLTQEQKERIKANREEALKKRAAAEEKLKLQQPSQPVEEQQNSSEIIKNKNLISVDFKFYLLSSERFKLEFHPFDSSIPLKLKEIPSRNYDSANKIWNFLLKDYEVVKNKLNQLRSKNVLAKFDEIPLGVRKLFLDKISPRNLEPSSSESTSSCLDKADPKIVETLFPFQRSGVSFGIRRGGRLLIADEMGLGKTVQALAIASAFRGEWPLLIICPSSVKYMWYRQIKRFLPSARPCLVEKAKDDLPRSRCTNLIMSYTLMEMRAEELKRENFYVLIFDECHMLKESKTKRTSVADALAKRANRIILLSGTPALSRPAELFSQIKMIDPKIFPYYKNYASRYCDGKMGRFGFEAKGQSNAEELKAVMEKIMIRRLKKDVLEDLPEKRREIIFLSGDAIDNKMKQLLKARDEFESANKFSIDNKTKRQTFLEYYVLTGQVKKKPVAEHIVDTYFYDGAPPKKILVFAHHLEILDFISIELAKVGAHFIRIDGSTPARDRSTYCEQFQTDKRIRAALLSITAAGTGITLTAASVVIFAELYWNPSLMIQAEDRAHRVGQRDSVQVQYLIAKNTADVLLWDLVGSKLQVLGIVNLANETYLGADKSSKLCTNSQKVTDFFEILNKLDEDKNEGEKDPLDLDFDEEPDPKKFKMS
uniref:SWI/SNF-related matrix-associated actin-dependent regulator of chromatin subfamily A-like protein 1 n=1 Tax=Meloidogyne javanica TaxID=6303 RepID=A0A915LVK7_MELJA